MDPIRVMAVEDHPIYLDGVCRIVDSEPDMAVIAALGDGGEVLEQVREHQPDVIVMDVNLPNQNGLALTRAIKADFPSTAVIVLTGYTDEEQLFHAIRSGASAYYAKDECSNFLARAIREVTRGNYVIEGEVMSARQAEAWLLKQFEALSPTGEILNEERFNPLTFRQMEILTYVTKGYSNKEIAHRRNISNQTVKNHMSAVLHKLGVSDRTQAAVYALRLGWVRLQDAKYEP